MTVLARAKTHFKERLAEELQSLDVPEWEDENGEPTKIYFRSSMNLKQKSIILKHYQKDELDKAIAFQLIFRCRDKDGKLIFNANQLDQILAEIDPDVASKIISEIEKGETDIEEIKGN